MIITGVMLLGSVASALILHGARAATGVHATPRQERAWFSYPTEVDSGIGPGETLFFTVVATNTNKVFWREYDNGKELWKGNVPGIPGQELIVQIPSIGSKTHTWLTVWVGDLKVPLKVWVG